MLTSELRGGVGPVRPLRPRATEGDTRFARQLGMTISDVVEEGTVIHRRS